MYDSPQHDAGRLRRLILTAAPPFLIPLVPLLLVVVFRHRLPDQTLDAAGWSPDLSAGLRRWWTDAVLPAGLGEVLFVAMFMHYGRWPELQRWVTASSLALGVSKGASNGFAVAALIDAEGPVPRQAWATPAEIALTLLAAVAGWWLAGPPPPRPTATGTPPPGLPMLSLAPGQRAVYAVSTWHRAPLLQGAMFLALAWFWAPYFSPFWQQPTMAAFLGVFLVLQARTRLRVDSRGVEVSLPWLGCLRRALPYDAVQFASARPRTSATGPGGLIGGSRGWGYVSGREPVLALRLTDGREFLYSTRDAETAAALVNASLARARGADGC
ncbi:hypothetical protein AB0C14_29860 [Microbispora hainanensis]|uniref:hypothetical protein n=1 Tax=Microbispora hainanensis TaxID=568844 RepID=UPI0033FE1383